MIPVLPFQTETQLKMSAATDRLNASLAAYEKRMAGQAESDDAATIKRSERRRKAMSPPGSLGLPPKLEARRLEYGITDGFFRFQPMYDRIFVHQTFQFDSKTFVPGGKIEMSDSDKRRERESAPQGIVVGAGLGALDALRSNGADVGDVVAFIQQAPWRMEVDRVEGDSFWMIIFQAGDILGSMDLADRIRAGECEIKFDEGNYQHQIQTPDGKIWNPKKPWVREDF